MEEKNLEITLRITEIQAILENNLYEDKKEEQDLVTELEQLEKREIGCRIIKNLLRRKLT